MFITSKSSLFPLWMAASRNIEHSGSVEFGELAHAFDSVLINFWTAFPCPPPWNEGLLLRVNWTSCVGQEHGQNIKLFLARRCHLQWNHIDHPLDGDFTLGEKSEDPETGSVCKASCVLMVSLASILLVISIISILYCVHRKRPKDGTSPNYMSALTTHSVNDKYYTSCHYASTTVCPMSTESRLRNGREIGGHVEIDLLKTGNYGSCLIAPAASLSQSFHESPYSQQMHDRYQLVCSTNSHHLIGYTYSNTNSKHFSNCQVCALAKLTRLLVNAKGQNSVVNPDDIRFHNENTIMRIRNGDRVNCKLPVDNNNCPAEEKRRDTAPKNMVIPSGTPSYSGHSSSYGSLVDDLFYRHASEQDWQFKSESNTNEKSHSIRFADDKFMKRDALQTALCACTYHGRSDASSSNSNSRDMPADYSSWCDDHRMTAVACLTQFDDSHDAPKNNVLPHRYHDHDNTRLERYCDGVITCTALARSARHQSQPTARCHRLASFCSQNSASSVISCRRPHLRHEWYNQAYMPALHPNYFDTPEPVPVPGLTECAKMLDYSSG